MNESGNKTLRRYLKKNAWLFCLLAAGILLMLLPGGSSKSPENASVLREDELRLAGALRRMEGVGEVYVLLAEKPGRDDGYAGAVIVCDGAANSIVKLRIVQTVNAYTGLGSDRIVIEKLVS